MMPSFASRSLLRLLAGVCAVARVAADLGILTDQYDAFNAGAYGTRPNQTFVSSDLIAPRLQVNIWDKTKTTSGSHIFMTPFMQDGVSGPMILSSKDLSLVYSDPSFKASNDAKIQIYNNTPYLTYWAGLDLGGHGSGNGYMLDANYHVVKTVSTDLPDMADSHEFKLTWDGGALLNNYHKIQYDLTRVGGPVDGGLLDCAFQEVDLETGAVRFTWEASDHFDLTESMGDGYWPQDIGWDWFHMNSLFKTLDGNYLISSRHLRMVALISGKDGSKIWQVGGKNNDFQDLSGGRASNFAFQHHARFVDESYTLETTYVEITLFDNRVMHPSSPTPGCTADCSRGMRIALDFNAKTVRLVSEFHHSKSVQAWAEGGYHRLENGNVMIGWGVPGGFSEYTETGETVLEVQNGPFYNTGEAVTQLYRVFKFDWKAYPTWGPSIGYANQKVYVSWNGATEVVNWTLTGGRSTKKLSSVDQTVSRAGFETEITPVNTELRYLRVQALDADGTVLGMTGILDTQTGNIVESPRPNRIATWRQ